MASVMTGEPDTLQRSRPTAAATEAPTQVEETSSARPGGEPAAQGRLPYDLSNKNTPDQETIMRQAERAVFDLRRGLTVLLRGEAADTLIHPAESLSDTILAELRTLSGNRPTLSLTRHRLASIGEIIAQEAATLALPEAIDAEGIKRVAFQRGEALPAGTAFAPARDAELAAVRLLRRAQLVPAAIAVRVAPERREVVAAQVCDGRLLAVPAAEALALCAGGPGRLIQVSDARVPLANVGDCRFVLFREAGGIHEHVAILIGERAGWPDAVPVRLHSACLTGDVFGSQRCDCGEQLRRGMAAIREQGGGILLYLAQEGRGIGLANKFRAYRLQDQGLDTIDADQVIGFSKDERDFRIAQEMLEALAVHRITLLTNNPAKIEALRQAGIDVVNRQPIFGELTDHNQRYLNTKADRHGHWLHELLNDLDEPAAAAAILPDNPAD
ncbi:MAG: GTP cyclohydrolase II [Rhodocyclaceae bacterium]